MCVMVIHVRCLNIHRYYVSEKKGGSEKIYRMEKVAVLERESVERGERTKTVLLYNTWFVMLKCEQRRVG